MARNFVTYFLPIDKIQNKVCKKFGEKVIKKMISGSLSVSCRRRRLISSAENNFNLWLNLIPKIESHYCRQDSNRMYVGEEFVTLALMFKEYKRYSDEASQSHVGLTKFTALCKQKKVTVYSPKKDLCDKCLAYKNKQMQLDVYNGNGQIKRRCLTKIEHIYSV